MPPSEREIVVALLSCRETKSRQPADQATDDIIVTLRYSQGKTYKNPELHAKTLAMIDSRIVHILIRKLRRLSEMLSVAAVVGSNRAFEDDISFLEEDRHVVKWLSEVDAAMRYRGKEARVKNLKQFVEIDRWIEKTLTVLDSRGYKNGLVNR